MIKLTLVFTVFLLSCYAQTSSPPACGTQDVRVQPNCAADLTIAMDYSTAMGTVGQGNVWNLAQFVLQNYTNFLPISTTYVNTAIIGFGAHGITISSLFQQYANVCSEIQSQYDSYQKVGPSAYNLSDVFIGYSTFNRRSAYGIPTKFVLFTAINDQATIEAAIPNAKGLINSNVSIIIVGINQVNQSWLKELSPNVYFVNFNAYDANLTQFLLGNTCTFDITTTAIPATTPPSISDEIGTECSKDVSNLWLDIAIVIDQSLSMSAKGVENIVTTLQTTMYNFDIGQSGHHYTRVGIILFDNTSTIYANLSTYNSPDDFANGLNNLKGAGTNPKVNIENALQTAYNMLQSGSRNARKTVLLFASTYDAQSNDNPQRVANTMNEYNYFIIGVDYNDANNLAIGVLKNITAPGMFFRATDAENGFLSTELVNAFCYANCVCPTYTQQLFVITNQTTGNGKYYADCISGQTAGSFWKFAESGCEKFNGTLVSFTSQMKANFVMTKVIPSDLPSSNSFHIGLHRSNLTGQMSWVDYGGAEIPLGSYTNWAPGFPTPSGDCIFIDNLGPKWGWETEACVGGNILSYVCQYHACDATHDCIVPVFAEIPK